jgi:hypothetical protein
VVPSSLLGLALFVVLLAPGLAFVLRHERVVPARSYSGFRETLRVVFVSVASLTVTGVLLAVLRGTSPTRTPDVGQVARTPSAAIRSHSAELAWWSLGTVLFATLLATVAADPRVVRLLRRASRAKQVRWLTGATDTGIRAVSAWYQLMHLYDDSNPGQVVIGGQMDDGTYVEGRLFSFNAAGEDDADREIALSAPLRLTTVDGVRHDFAAQFTVISARRIVRLDVTHLDPTGDQADDPAPTSTAVPPLPK